MLHPNWLEYFKNRKAAISDIRKLERIKRKNKARRDKVEQLDDEYIKDLLQHQLKISRSEIPQEFIEIKRVIVAIRRKKQKLAEYVKVCKTHGPITSEQVNKYVEKGKIRMRCKKCQSEAHRKNYLKSTKDILVKRAIYRDENREKVRASHRVSNNKYRDKYRLSKNAWARKRYWENYNEIRSKENARKSKNRENLTDGYVRQVFIKRKGSLSQNDVPADVTDAMRAYMKLGRKIAEFKKNSGLKIKGCRGRWRIKNG